MEQEQCLGSTDENSLAASPMPFIGIYIAASTLVYLIFLLIDVCQGIRRSNHLLPSKFSSLNSLTLTLLATSTKIPVDLTSSMPEGVDQLSKLCGPVLITIAMGFFTPSLGDMKGFELLGNMISITILVVTVIVNVVIQMSTGVIFSFYSVEHVLALSLMLLTLVAMWYVAYIKHWVTGLLGDIWRMYKQELDSKDNDDKIGFVKAICATNSMITPQMVLCSYTSCVVYIDLICIISFGTLLEACVRTFFFNHLKFCSGESDYKWSLWIVLASQILTALIGAFAITYRSFYKSCMFLSNPLDDGDDPSDRDVETLMMVLALRKRILRFEGFKEVARSVSIQGLPLADSMMGLVKLVQVLEKLATYFFYGAYVIMGRVDYAVSISFFCFAKGISCVTRSSLDLASFVESTAVKMNEDMKKFLEKCEKENKPSSLIKLLQDNQSSQVLYEGSNACLSAVLLVRVASTKAPDLGKTLVDSLSEIFEMLCFIEQQSASSSFLQNLNKRVAKELWITRGLSDHWFQKKILSLLQKNCYSSDFDFIPLLAEHGLDTGTTQLSEIVNLWKMGYTDEDISCRLKQLFVDIMYFLLPQFPEIISDYVTQSPAADIEKRSKIALKFVCKYEMLVPHVEWLSGEFRYTQDDSTDPSEDLLVVTTE